MVILSGLLTHQPIKVHQETKKMKRTGIEPVSSAWKADVLPLYQRSEEQLQEPGIEPGAQRWQRWILPLNHSCNSANLAAC